MLTFIGIILLLVGIGVYVLNMYNASATEANLEIKKYNETLNGSYQKELKTTIAAPFKWYTSFGLGVFFIMLNGLFFWNDSGTITAIQYPWGGDKMVTTQGFKIKGWGRIIPMSYEISIQDIILKGEETDLPDSYDGIYNRQADRWEFSDAIKADIGTAIVIEIITEDESKFLSMADRNRSERKLIYGRVLPNIDAALKNTCKLMDAQEYISGKASDFDRYFRDQLQNGMYLVEEYSDQEDAAEIIGDTTTVRRIGMNSRNSKQKKFRIKRDEQGEPIRDNSSNSLSQYGIKFIQAQVTSIDWEKSFDERLDLQKDEVAKTQLEKQEAERQYYTAQKEVAKAESNKAKRRGELELKQVEETIAAETEAKVAVQNVIAEGEKLKVAKLQAKSKKVSADAIYYENIKRVQAGLTPQERAKMDIQKNKDTWDAIGGMKLDGVYMMGGQGSKGNDGLLSSLLGAEVAKGMKPSKTQ